MTEFTFEGRPPAAAVAYLEEKVVGGRLSFDWRDVWREEHLNAFVVAKAMKVDLLTDMHGALVTAIKAGWSRDRFVRELTPTLQAKGWWGLGEVTDPKDGKLKLAQLGSPRRLQTIFDVNMRMAHSAARWERFEASAETRPFLVYKHTPQANPRHEHLAWDGITLPIGHVFWKTHFCPNGWGCKCYQVSIRKAEALTSEEELQRLGVYDTRTYVNRRTGQVTKVPVGIDPGFDYNVGQARLANFVPPSIPERQRQAVQGARRPRALPKPLPPRDLPADVRLRPDLGGADAGAVFDAFSKALGTAEGGVFTDRAQVPLVVGRRLFERHNAAGVALGDKAGLAGRAEFAEILAATLRDPDEIWHSLQLREDGSSVLVRNFISAWNTEGGREWFVASFHQKEGVWWGVTAFPPGKRGRKGTQAAATDVGFRVGALVYRRK